MEGWRDLANKERYAQHIDLYENLKLISRKTVISKAH